MTDPETAVAFTSPKRAYLLSAPVNVRSLTDYGDLLFRIKYSRGGCAFYGASGECVARICFSSGIAEVNFPYGTVNMSFSGRNAVFEGDSGYSFLYTAAGAEYPIVVKNGRVVAEYGAAYEDKNVCKCIAVNRTEAIAAHAFYCAAERLTDGIKGS